MSGNIYVYIMMYTIKEICSRKKILQNFWCNIIAMILLQYVFSEQSILNPRNFRAFFHSKWRRLVSNYLSSFVLKKHLLHKKYRNIYYIVISWLQKSDHQLLTLVTLYIKCKQYTAVCVLFPLITYYYYSSRNLLWNNSKY